MTLVVQILYLVLLAFYLCMLARLVFGVTLRFARRWEPGRRSAVWLETVFSVTDPPLKGLRKVIPPLRLGNVAIDLAFLVLLIAVMIVMHGVLGSILQN